MSRFDMISSSLSSDRHISDVSSPTLELVLAVARCNMNHMNKLKNKKEQNCGTSQEIREQHSINNFNKKSIQN